MHEWGDSGITAVLLAIGVALLLSLFVSQQARARAARYKEVRRLQSVAAEEARREEEESHAEYTSMVARNFCAVCLNASTTRCSRCKVVRYCSSSCQIQHWNDVHKQECRAPDPVPSPVSSSNGSKQISDVYSSNGSPGSVGSRMLSEVSEVHVLEDATAPAELAKPAPLSNGNGVLLKPKMVLFPYDYFVKFFNWERLEVPPCGLLNCGNSCFANVVLQCLTYTRPLTAYLLEGTHGEECRRSDWCFMCELQDHVWRVRQKQNPFSPIRILSRIRNIGNHLGYGRQEDAHEFMRFAIDSMQSICLDEAGGEKNIDPRSQETTLIHYIFGGLLQSQVKCMQCLHESNRYENMMDLAVEIQGCVETLEDALTQFTAPEWLDGENKYKCDRCNDYVKARKRLTLHEAPNILTIALKRFQSGKFGKLNKRVTFPEVLDVSPYMSGKGDRPPLYRLYAVVVHVDMLNASFFGHYICYVKDSQGSWYKVDDSKVKEVDIEKVMAQRAYMLFYTRSTARPPPLADGVVSPYPVAEAADLVRVASAKRTGTKVFPGSQYLESEEVLEGAGAQGLHAMVDFNQMLDYNDGNTETVSEHILSNGEISTIHPSSWEVERIGSSSSNDDEIELEDAGCIASSSNVSQTSPYMSSFTSNHGLWIPTQGYVCQVPEAASVDGTESSQWGPKSSLPDDFSEVSLQPCSVEQPCSTHTGKRRLEDGLTPLPLPKPLNTDQLPAWPIGSSGRSSPCPVPIHHFSSVPSSSSMSDELLVQKYELIGKPLTLETFPTQKTVSSDLASLPALGDSCPDSEMTDNNVVETTDSKDEKIAGRAKRQHVEVDRLVDPIFEVHGPDEVLKAVEHPSSCDSEVRDMDWDAASEHLGSLTAGAEPCEEDPSADITSMPSSHGQVILNQQLLLPFASEGSASVPQKEAHEFDEFEELHEGVVVIPQSSEALQVGSQPHSGLQPYVLGTTVSFPEVTRGDHPLQPGIEDAILETGSSNHESGISLPTEPDSSKNASSTGARTDSASVPLPNGPALQVPDKPRPKSSKSPARPLFAPGFLNKPRTPCGSERKSSSSTPRSGAAVENGYEKNSGVNLVCENGASMDQSCSSKGKSHVKDVTVITGSDQLRPTQGISLAAVNDDTSTAPNGKVSSIGNNNFEACNSATLDSQSQNGHETESVTAPDTKENHLAKILSKNDLGYSSKSTRQNTSGNGNGSSLNSLQVNIDEEPSVEPVSEAVAVSGRAAPGKQKQGRNETCNCGSQRKWKKCCGKTGVIKSEVGRRRLVA